MPGIGLFSFSDRGIKKQTGRKLPTRDYQSGTPMVLAGIENPFDWSEQNNKRQASNTKQIPIVKNQ